MYRNLVLSCLASERYVSSLPFYFFLGVFAPAVHAQSISSIGSANVSKGSLAVEARTGYALDNDQISGSQDERFRTRLHADYGVTDSYAARIILKGDKRKNSHFEHDSMEFENRFELFSSDTYGFDGGVRFTYALKDGDKKPDTITMRLVEVIPLDNWEIRFNQFFSHEVGEDSEGGLLFESRMQATYAVSNKFRAGLDSFNNFGKLNDLSGYSAQAHTAGPVLKYGLSNGYGIETGYLAGLSTNAADHTFRLFLSKKF